MSVTLQIYACPMLSLLGYSILYQKEIPVRITKNTSNSVGQMSLIQCGNKYIAKDFAIDLFFHISVLPR